MSLAFSRHCISWSWVKGDKVSGQWSLVCHCHYIIPSIWDFSLAQVKGFANPLSLELSFYPDWIESKEKIRIK
ncbi:hypothetical protein [Bacillus sp. FJAT-18017]|uniref:hypothetical protein n=1 Tax=Bacillus sp. FJAT-18017 TaxID=1705566 RepID=UPI000A77F2C0|nr:hypothetical protein [Bacillus sp. FJAT-18017]